MASPQPDQYTKFSNELLREMYRHPFTGAQFRLILAVARLSYGWGAKRTKEPLGAKAMAREAAMARSSVRFASEGLLNANVLERSADGRWGINKDYESWKLVGGRPVNQKGAAHRPRGGRPTALL